MKITNNPNWQRTIVYRTFTLKDVAENLTETGLRTAVLVDQNGCLVGTISDGDIRRGLLKGLSLESSILEVVQRDPLYVNENALYSEINQLMQSNKIYQLPKVDAKNKVTGLYTCEDLLSPQVLPNKMLIMAGGKGLRLRPHTQDCPKPMLPVHGKPMLQHIIERARDEGFNEFLLSVHYLAEIVENYFKDGRDFGVQIDYIYEDEPLGTAGAISLVEEEIKEPLLVTNGDVLTTIKYADFIKFHNDQKASATMAVKRHELHNPYGVVKVNELEIVGFEEKPVVKSYINAGIYVLSPDSLKVLKTGEYCDMPNLFDRIKDNKHRTIVYPMYEDWNDVGVPADLMHVNK